MKTALADNIIKNNMIWATGSGLIPIPLLGIGAVTAIQLDMLKKLSNLHGHDYTESNGKALVGSVAGSSIARLGAEAIKAVPGVGSIIGGISSAILSGASTYALGHVFKNHFEKGGNLFDFSASEYRDFYDQKFKEGKKEAKKAKEEQAKPHQKNSKELNRLEKLYREKKISKADYQSFKRAFANS